LTKDMQSDFAIRRSIQSSTINVHPKNNMSVNPKNNLFSVIFSKS